MDTFLKDIRHSLRTFLRSPGFTIAALAALALGIGANTAIFSVVNRVLLKPLPYPQADRIVAFLNTSREGSGQGANIPKFMTWKSKTQVVEEASAYDGGSSGVNITGGSSPELIHAAHVSEGYFRLFGARTILGRTFSPSEDLPRAGKFVVLSHGLWQRRYASDPGIVGKTVDLSGDPHVILGVISKDFDQETPIDAWLPFQFDPNSRDQAHYFVAAARLKPGVTLAQANAQMKVAAEDYRRMFPGFGKENSFAVTFLQDETVSEVRTSLLVMAGAVSFVLLIACANVANLLLVRATGRRREIAIRSAMGAARGRIIRQLLTESILLFLGGGIAGLALGMWGVRGLLAVSPGNIPRIGENIATVTLDWHVVAFTLGVSLLTGLVFGLIPALGVSRADLSATLKESASRTGTGFRQNKARSLLVIGEVALALVLLCGAGLLIRTFAALRSVNAGFNPNSVLTMRVSLSGPRFQTTAGVATLARNSVNRLQAIPGVERAAFACCLPLEGGFGLPFLIPGRPLPAGEENHGGGGYAPVGDGYFEALKMPLLRGRTFTARDEGASTPVAIINETMAKRFWPKADPLADRIVIGAHVGPEFDDAPRQIIGIVADSRDGGLNRDPGPKMFIPIAQMPDGITALNSRIAPIRILVRTKVAPYTLRNAIEKTVQEASGLPVANVRSMDEVVSRSVAREDFAMVLLTIFGASAILLAAIGIYGLMAYSVAQRTQEIGIRMSLGAGTWKILNMMVWQGMRLVWIGAVIGIAAAYGLTRLMASFLYAVKPTDPMSFIGAAVLLSVVALLAVCVPAMRATRVSPTEALRYE